VDLLVIRHAIAEDREVFAGTGADDSLRPLTDRGRERMEEGARGLCRVVKRLDVLGTSPLTRAVQTAEILSGAYGGIQPEVVQALSPDVAFHPLVDWLRSVAQHETVAIVGHEPHLSEFVTLLLVGREGPHLLDLKKGAACLVALNGQVTPGRGRLKWFLTPTQLRKLGRLPD
jgi:phosphohistidine phosphatase